MECLGPQCAAMLLDWLKARAAGAGGGALVPGGAARPTPPAELAGALEHLQYAVFRRYKNQLTRAERARLDNSIDNALFKIDRYLLRLHPTQHAPPEAEGRELRGG